MVHDRSGRDGAAGSTDPVVAARMAQALAAGEAFEARFGRPRNGWRRAVAPSGVFYTRRGLRADPTLVPCDGGARVRITVSHLAGTGQPDLDEILAVRSELLPLALRVELGWASRGDQRVPVLEVVVPAVDTSMQRVG